MEFSPSEGVCEIRKENKVKSKIFWSFEIIELMGPCIFSGVTVSVVFKVFHISLLQKYEHDPSYKLDYHPITRIWRTSSPNFNLDRKEQVIGGFVIVVGAALFGKNYPTYETSLAITLVGRGYIGAWGRYVRASSPLLQ